jgi:hypothetical protein
MRARSRVTKKAKKQSGGQHRIDFSELGEGRSTSIYLEPTVTDTAVLMVFYNPARFTRILKNILYVMKVLKEKKIPCYVIECVFDDQQPQVTGANMVVRSNSYMFYKEQLLNKLETIVPEQYTKIVTLDGDIMFDAPDWIDQISVALDTYDIIQPYDKACWLTPDNKRIGSWKYGYAYALKEKIAITKNNVNSYHPGFAWAFKRKTFQDLGGFFPKAVIGSGDGIFTFNFLKGGIPSYWKHMMTLGRKNIFDIILEDWPAYHENFQRVDPKIGYINVKAMHLFHGLRMNRQYVSRYAYSPIQVSGKTWDEVFTTNKDGLTEFIDPSMRKSLFRYFKTRNEDIPLDQAIKLLQKGSRKRATTTTVNQAFAKPAKNSALASLNKEV